MKKVKGFILDISSPDSSFIDISTRVPYGIVTNVYKEKVGYKVSSVVDGKTPLWISTERHSCDHVVAINLVKKSYYSRDYPVKLLVVYTRDSEGASKPLYYENHGDWDSLIEEEFYRIFHIEALKGSTLETVTLDVKGNNDPAMVYINDSSNFPFIAYAPNVGYRIDAVKNGKGIWTAQSKDEGCLYTSLYPKDGPILAYLVIHSSEGLKELCYSKFGNLWREITKHAYLESLRNAGFDMSKFANEVTVDLSKPDQVECYIRGPTGDKYGGNLYFPFVGFRMRAIVDDGEEVWRASGDERCTYINTVHHNRSIFAFYMLVDDPKGNRNVLYFFKRDGEWKGVTKSEYHALMPVRVNALALPKIENPKIIMSSFRNKNGLRLTSYASTVENARANIILIHGICSHFMSEFGTSNVEWNYEHYGSPVSLDIKGIFLREHKHKRNVVDIHRHIFEHASLEGKDASLVQPGYEYEGSLIEFLNKMGYNVYGMDLQAHGLSEAQTELKCHVKDFKDYLHDALQFVSIVKRGAFNDSSEEWNEETVFASHPTDKKLILWGNSMGGNIVMQAVQEFYRMANNPSAHFVDGLIVTSGMLNLDHYLNTMVKRVVKSLLSPIVWYFPTSFNTYESTLDYGELFDLFLRHREPFFHSNRLTLKTTKFLFDACADVNKNMSYYPKDLPTILIHATDDGMCSIKGPRDLMETHFKDSNVAKFVEVDTSFHYLTAPQAMIAFQPHLKEWLDKYTNVHPSLTGSTVSA